MTYETYLIVIESEGAGKGVYHHQPFRIASSLNEAKEMMGDYLACGAERDDMTPDFFLLYKESNGRFNNDPIYYDFSLNEIDATEWLQRTGRV